MGSVHGKVTVVTIDGDDISAFCNSVTFPNETDMHENTTFGQDRKTYHPGLGDGKITIGGPYDTDAAGPADILETLQENGTEATFIYRIRGTGSGLPQKSVSVLVATYNESSPVGDIVTWTAELQMTGDLDRSPQA